MVAEGGIAAYRLGQAYDQHGKDNGAAAGYAGEALLRMIGVGLSAHSMSSMKNSIGSLAPKSTARLTSRADEIHSALDPIARKQRTTAVLETDMGDIIGGGVRDLSPAQRALQQQGEILSKLAGEHAEITALQEAIARGAKPRAIGTTRDFCDACRKALEEAGATITGPRTAIWP